MNDVSIRMGLRYDTRSKEEGRGRANVVATLVS